MADVLVEAGSQFVQRRQRRGVVLLELVSTAAQVHVLDQHAYDGLVVRRAAARVAGQQHVFLDAEVVRALAVPEGEERGAGVGRVALGRAPQRERGEQTVVVVMREGRELIASLHPRGSSA